jgi:methyl-accepting chemotaxis protein
MKFRRNAPLTLIAAVVLVVIGMAAISNRLFSGMTGSMEQSQFDLMRSIFAFNVKGAEGRALARAEMVSNIPAVQDAFATQSRERVLAETAEMFRIQKEKYSVDQAAFHLPPGTAFLRLQAPTLHGDDLSKFRPMVVAVNKDQISPTGMEVARTGPAIFGVVPMRDRAGKHTGSFEIGIDAGSVLDSLKAAYGFEMALFIEEQPLKEHATGINPEVMSDENRLGKYMKVHATNWGLLQNLVSSTDLGEMGDGTQYTREALGVPYGVVLIELRNSAGVPVGVVAIAMDFSGTRDAEGRSTVWQALLALFGIVLLAGVIIVVVRGFLLRPLAVIDEQLATLAAGGKPEPIENPETLCKEMQSIAAHAERLRVQQSPPPVDKQAGP